jgi:tetratricopeptide (TPR) repeat protein
VLLVFLPLPHQPHLSFVRMKIFEYYGVLKTSGGLLQMRRINGLGMTVFLTLAFAVPGFSQARAAQARTPAEYSAYMAVYGEQDALKRAAAGEKFLTEFNESDFIPQTHTMLIGAYSKSQNWAKVMESADRAAASPVADNTLKAFAFGNAMMAAQNTNNVDKVVSYGDKVLAIAPNDIDTMMVVSSVIPTKLPADEAGKKAALDKASSLATKALSALQPLIAQAEAAQKPTLVQAESQLHATLGLVAFNRPDYKKSIEEYDAAVKGNPKDDLAHYYLGADYSALASQASKDYQAAFKAWNDAKVARADQPTIDELDARQQGMGSDVTAYRDKAIDEFAIAVAIGGSVAQQARSELSKLWMTKNGDTSGIDAFIAQKK